MSQDAPVALYNHVDRVFPELQTLSESAEAVKRIAGEPGFQAIRQLLHAEVERLDRSLDNAPLREATEYAHAHGRRGALLAFEDAVTAIVERATAREREAENEAAGESAAER